MYEMFPRNEALGSSPFDESIHGSHIKFDKPAHTSRIHNPPRIRKHHKRMVPRLDRFKRPNMEGLEHYGVAPKLRHYTTDFGSRWQGMKTAGISKAMMKRGNGRAVVNAGTACISSVQCGSRRIKNSL